MGTGRGATPSAFGLRAHSGWAALVAVAGSPESPAVLLRRRVELADPGTQGSKQPYHAAEGRKLAIAEKIVNRCAADARGLAREAVRSAIRELEAEGHRVVGCGLLLASGRPLPELASILASHALIHTADGELFRDALAHAMERCGLPVTRVREKEVFERAAKDFRTAADALRQRVDEIGRPIGPPWTQDQKLASVAGWLALAGASP